MDTAILEGIGLGLPEFVVGGKVIAANLTKVMSGLGLVLLVTFTSVA